MTDETGADLAERGRFRHWSANPLRYNDTDRQGHVNNVAYATFCEQGRIGLMMGGALPPLEAGHAVVVARLEIDYLRETFWPGVIDVGSAVLAVGRSSVTIGQGLFDALACVATSRTVIVLTDLATRRPAPWPDGLRAALVEDMTRG